MSKRLLIVVMLVLSMVGFAFAGPNQTIIHDGKVKFIDSTGKSMDVRLNGDIGGTAGNLNVPESPGTLARLNDDITGATSGNHTGNLNGVAIGNIVATDGNILIGWDVNAGEWHSVAPSGTQSITNTGVFSNVDNSIVAADIQNSVISKNKMADDSVGYLEVSGNINTITVTMENTGNVANALIANYPSGVIANDSIISVLLNTPGIAVNTPTAQIFNGTTEGGALLSVSIPEANPASQTTFKVKVWNP
jgi:hypothetical protein